MILTTGSPDTEYNIVAMPIGQTDCSEPSDPVMVSDAGTIDAEGFAYVSAGIAVSSDTKAVVSTTYVGPGGAYTGGGAYFFNMSDPASNWAVAYQVAMPVNPQTHALFQPDLTRDDFVTESAGSMPYFGDGLNVLSTSATDGSPGAALSSIGDTTKFVRTNISLMGAKDDITQETATWASGGSGAFVMNALHC